MDAQFNNPNNGSENNPNNDNPQAEKEVLNREQTSVAGDTAYNNGQTGYADQKYADQKTENQTQTSFASNENFNNPQAGYADQKYAAQETQSHEGNLFASNENYNYQQAGYVDQKYVSFLPYGFTPKTFEEKKGIRKAALITGLSVLILMGVSFFWATAYFFVMGRLGIDYNRAL